MGADDKQIVYRLSNIPCTPPVNGVFNISAAMNDVRRKILESVEKHLESHGLSWLFLRDELDLSLQQINNWKTRGIPESWHARIAETLGVTVDELLGIDKRPLITAWPFRNIPIQRFSRLAPGDQLAAEGALLDKIIEIEGEGERKSRKAGAAKTTARTG